MEEIKQRARAKISSSSENKCDADIIFGSLSLEDVDYSKPNGVGIVYDDRMLAHKCIWVPNYPETSERLETSVTRCRQYGLVDRCVQIPARQATQAEILRCHSEEIFECVKSSADMTVDQLMALSTRYDAVYFNEASYESAMLAAGSTVEVVDKVVKGEVRHGMAFVRPPGHHAMYNEPCGYCIFNNAAIGVRHALDVLGLERVLVVDWDIHHGQGTQYAFYNDPRVVYFSMHRYEFGTFWPNLRQSDYDFIGGKGDGRGMNINVPLNKMGLTNGDYMAVLQQIVMPVAFEFNPQLVLVSSGYDASIGDPEGRSEITPAAFAHFTHMMKQLAEGKLVILFEGGYCIKSLAEGVALTLRCLLDDPCPNLGPLLPPLDSTVESILHVIRVLRPYWRCFAYHENASDDTRLPAVFKNIEIPKSGVEFFTDDKRPESFSLQVFERLADDEVQVLDGRIDMLIAQTCLDVPVNRTCIIYDERMSEHQPVNQFGHVEDPSRIKRVFSMLSDTGLVSRCRILLPREATKDEIALVHSMEYIDRIERYASCSDDELALIERSFDSIYLSKVTFKAATLATGCTLTVVDEVLTGKSLNGFAVVRPPGHHAEKTYPTGFCIFNSVAIAAKYAQQKYGVQKILILDWDIHHGNGTQSTFETDPGVLYISLHRQDIFPPGDRGKAENVGHGAGAGFNINIPWLKCGMGDAEYMAAFQQIIMPVAYEFGPDLVLVSAGFDAALGDPLGVCKVSPAGYSHMTHMLSSLAAGKVILVLEGGYNLNALSESAVACMSVLLGDRVPPLKLKDPPAAVAIRTISYVIHLHQHYWKSLAYHVWMPSRRQTLEWLGDDMNQLSAKAAEILQHEDLAFAKQQEESHRMNQPIASSAHSVVAETKDESDIGASGGQKHKQTLLDQLKQIAAEQDDVEFFAVEPLPFCPHLQFIEPVPTVGINSRAPCQHCHETKENWICLTCYQVYCSRYVNGHMEEHWKHHAHSMVLSLSDLSTWCYTCSAYVHNAELVPAKEAAYCDKFGEK